MIYRSHIGNSSKLLMQRIPAMNEPIIDARYRTAYHNARVERAKAFRDAFRWVRGRRQRGQETT